MCFICPFSLDLSSPILLPPAFVIIFSVVSHFFPSPFPAWVFLSSFFPAYWDDGVPPPPPNVWKGHEREVVERWGSGGKAMDRNKRGEGNGLLFIKRPRPIRRGGGVSQSQGGKWEYNFKKLSKSCSWGDGFTTSISVEGSMTSSASTSLSQVTVVPGNGVWFWLFAIGWMRTRGTLCWGSDETTGTSL